MATRRVIATVRADQRKNATLVVQRTRYGSGVRHLTFDSTSTHWSFDSTDWTFDEDR